MGIELLKIFTKLVQHFSKKQRQKKINIIKDAIDSGACVLDVGVWCKIPEPNPSENWLEKKVLGQKIIALGLDNMESFHIIYPSVLCVQANGCALPFINESVDILFSNAVLEHIPVNKQDLFISEFTRVTRREAEAVEKEVTKLTKGERFNRMGGTKAAREA